MNLLKSLFIFIAPAWLIFIIVYGAIGILNSSHVLYNSGVVLSALPLALFLSYIMLFKKLARTSEYLLILLIPSFIGYTITLVFFIIYANFSLVTGMMMALSAFLVTFLYVFWYSNNSRVKSSSLLNAQILPEFSVQDTAGNSISSSEFKQKSLIFFYRGNWCPLCMAQIDEIVEQYQKFADKNIDVIFISPQPSNNSKKLADKFNLPFKFYVDSNNQAAKEMGLEHVFGLPMGFQALGYDSNSVYPTVIAIDEKRKIIYNDQTSNYRVRPEPQELLEIF
jgi:peroxiredoxin